MADAALKPEKDFSKEADVQISEAEKLAKVHISGLELLEYRLLMHSYRMISKQLSRSLPFSRSKPDR